MLRTTRVLVMAALVAVAAAACDAGPAPGTPDPQTTSTRVGRFELQLTVDRTTLRPDDDITGTASLFLRAGGSGALSGSGTMFLFEFAEVGGEHRFVTPVQTADCAPHQVSAERPLTSPILKSGASSDSAFANDFLKGRAVHLPAGDWDITAVAGFHEGQGCPGPEVTLRATVRVHVTP